MKLKAFLSRLCRGSPTILVWPGLTFSVLLLSLWLTDGNTHRAGDGSRRPLGQQVSFHLEAV